MRSLLLALACLSSAASAQPQAHTNNAPQNPPQPQMLTYAAQRYLEAEQGIERIFSQGAFQTLAPHLDEQFTVRNPNSADFDKHRWFKAQSTRASQAWIIADLDARLVDGLCIVSFTLLHPKTSRRMFVVDVWREQQNKLLTRYESDLPKAPASSMPQETDSKPGIRPSGKG